MVRTESMKLEPTQVCGMSPMKRGADASRQTTSAHWFHAGGRWPAEQDVEQVERALALAEAHEGADVAQLVGRVAVVALRPGLLAFAAHARSSARRCAAARRSGRCACSPPRVSAIAVEVGSKSPSSAEPGMKSM